MYWDEMLDREGLRAEPEFEVPGSGPVELTITPVQFGEAG